MAEKKGRSSNLTGKLKTMDVKSAKLKKSASVGRKLRVVQHTKEGDLERSSSSRIEPE